ISDRYLDVTRNMRAYTRGTVVDDDVGTGVVVRSVGASVVVVEVEVVVDGVSVTGGPGVPTTASGRRSTKTRWASGPRYTTDWPPAAVPTRPGTTTLVMERGSMRRARAASCSSGPGPLSSAAWRSSTPIQRRRPLSLPTSWRILPSAASTRLPWLPERVKSPAATSWRSREYARAAPPSKWCQPGWKRAPE